jgi:uncharacterized membrane protein YeaQ/YmgE (transglycosylase-associated protein family)
MEFSVGAAVIGAIIGILATKISPKLGAVIAFAGFLPLIITMLTGTMAMSSSDPATASQIATNTTGKIADQGAGMIFDTMIATVVGAFVAAGLAIFVALKHVFR